MGSFVRKIGYCKDCRRNVEHVHGFSFAPIKLVDAITLRIFPILLGIGCWHCRLCNRKSIVLNGRRRDAENDRPTIQTEEEFQTAGNYIKRDVSLVMRQERNSRYSSKFRQGVVHRILTGHATIMTIRDELNVSEKDIIGWINDLVAQQKEQIDDLHRMVDALVDNLPESARLESQIELTPKQ